MFVIDQIVRGWNRMAGAFQGLRVLDLSRGIAGPMTTMFLADNGAEVIRIEPPLGDPFAQQTGYRVWNRGKRSICLDLRSEEGRRQFDGLARTADVVVDSFSWGTTEKLGIDHEALSALNPTIITCSITAYGEHAFTAIAPAMTGWSLLGPACCSTRRAEGGRPWSSSRAVRAPSPNSTLPKVWSGAPIERGRFSRVRRGPASVRPTSQRSGLLRRCERVQVSGLGQRVATSLLQGALAAACLNWQRVENPDAPLYWMWPVDSRSIEGLYECADGKWVHHWTLRPQWVLAAAEGQKLSPRELEAGYRNDPDRVSMEPDGMLSGIFLHPQLAEAFKKFPSDEWVRAAEEAGLGITTVRSPGEALADKSLLADGCVVEVDDPEEGPIRHVGPLLEFSATPGSVSGPAPRPGQDTEDVLAGIDSKRRPSSVTEGTHRSLAHPLAGIRVLDLGLGVAGPFTGRALADLGADVIKVNALHDTILERHAHGPGHQPGEAQHCPESQEAGWAGGAREAPSTVGCDHAELEAGARRAWDSTTRRFESATRHWSTAIPGATKRVRGRICPALTRMRRH